MYNKKFPPLKEWCKDNKFHGSVGHGCAYLRLFISVTILAILFMLISAQPIAAMTSYEHQRGVEIAESHQILFDGDFEVLDSIHLNNEDYFIIRQKNLFLFANRLDIYRSDGRVVENHYLSKSIFEVYAWKQQIDKLKAIDRSDLRSILTTSENIESKVAPLHQVTGAAVSAIDKAKSIEIKSIYVWDTATKLKPELKTFENTVRGFNNEVGEWDSASSKVNANLPDVIKGLDAIDKGEKIDWTRFAYDTKASVTAFNELSEKTSQMSHRVSNIRETLDKVKKGLSSIGAGFLADAFNDLDGKLGSVQSSIEGYTNRLNRHSREFKEISWDVERIERDMYDEWTNDLDNEAALKLIYCLIIAIIIGIIVSIITGLTDFRMKLITERAVFLSSVKQGLSMFAGSICIGILIFLVFNFQVLYIITARHYTTINLPNINIPFLSSDLVASYYIFILYIISLFIIFAIIYGILAKKYKVDCIVPFWIGNYMSLLFIMLIIIIILILVGYPEYVIISIIPVLPLLLLASIIFPIIYLIGRKRKNFRDISTFLAVILLVILLIYRTYTENIAIFILLFVFGVLCFLFYAWGISSIKDSIAKYGRKG